MTAPSFVPNRLDAAPRSDVPPLGRDCAFCEAFAMLTRSHAARRERRRRKSELKRMLEARYEARKEADRKTFDAWFEAFDTDGNRRLDKAELAALLLTLQPEAPPAPATDAIAMLASMAMLASR